MSLHERDRLPHRARGRNGHNPSISEDGKHIAFESNETGAQFDIYLAENPLHDDFIM